MMATEKKQKTSVSAIDNESVSIRGEIFSLFLDKNFSARGIINEQDTKILRQKIGILFKKAHVIWADLKIPKLNPADDIRVYEITDYQTGNTIDESESIFLYNRPEIKLKFDEAISSLLTFFDLAGNFREWLTYFILYKRIPHKDWNPNYGLDSLIELSGNQGELPKNKLLTSEKKFLKQIKKKELGITGGRPPIKVQDKYNQFKKLLAKSKNTRRRLKNLEVLKTFEGRTYKEVAKEATNTKGLPINMERLKKKKYRQTQRLTYLEKS
ncbi:MAG: hypothetical protein Q8R55_03770 [Candidatus Taylorbacteria bacterium]|nr:hypothetical protein [Candidatus Taylorbacteria bacterium]